MENKENQKEIYILGNPPFLGATFQSKEQKEDILHVFRGLDSIKNLDYVTCWFYLAAQYVRGTENCRAAFVATNSITQGEQVWYLWRHILKEGVEIDFACQSFKWANNAKDNAGVCCVVVGLRNECEKKKFLFRDGERTEAKNINAYLLDAPSVFVEKERTSISGLLPPMFKGNMPTDGGNLILSPEEKKRLISSWPSAEKFIRRLVGSREFIQGIFRYCLWISNEELEEARKIPPIAERIERVAKLRRASRNLGTVRDAARSHQFQSINIKEKYSSALLIPRHSSERRDYIPIGYLGPDAIIVDSAHAVYDAPDWLFGILTSRMHMVWVRAVCGRLKTDLRYSSELCYNTFPFPAVDEDKRQQLSAASGQIIAVRERYLADRTMAELYSPDKETPIDLKAAHERLDSIVDSCFQSRSFRNDEERLALLFREYRRLKEKSSGNEKSARRSKAQSNQKEQK